jgi:hypothetical protein
LRVESPVVKKRVQLRDIRLTVPSWEREAEEAVARERLLKTQQAGKELRGCLGDL